VFYHFRPSSGGDELPLPAYFHQRDEHDVTQAKGVDQLGVEIDLVLAADPEPPLARGRGPGEGFSAAAAARHHALAGRHQPGLPRGESADEGRGGDGATRAARGGARDPGRADGYRLRRQREDRDLRQPTGGPVSGDACRRRGGAARWPGTMASWSSAALRCSADAAFEVVVSSDAASKACASSAWWRLQVLVRPNAALRVSATADAVAVDAGTLRSSSRKPSPASFTSCFPGRQPSARRFPGNGASIVLPTGPIAADTTFSVAAARADQPEIAVVLAAQATVKIRSGA
jgi:hypothetical protein